MNEMLCRALVITSTPGSGAVNDAVRASALAALADYTILQEDQLSPGDAWRVLFVAAEDVALAPLRLSVERAVAGAAVDINVIADDIAYTRKKLLVADMESTIIEQEMLDELGDLIGKRSEIEGITARAMRGELDFEAALKARVGMLAGLDASVLDEMVGRITLMPGARALIATMQENGAYCALVSGGFTFFTAHIARLLGFDEHRANVLEIADGKLTGRVAPPILGREAKLDALRHIARERNIDMTQTLAVGDGANDLHMLMEAGVGVAFRAKPNVQATLAQRDNGAVVTHGDLTALLYLQGYAARDHLDRSNRA